MLPAAAQLVYASEESFEVRKEIDIAFNELSTVLSFVTFANAFYVLMVLYLVVLTLCTIIFFKKRRSKIFDSSMTSVEVEK